MSNFIITPLMSLPNPVPSVDPGPDYATNLYNSLSIIDGHNHSVGSGNQINPTGLVINTDLPFGSNNATLLRSVRFTPQNSPLAGAADLGCLYEAGGELYYNDASGNQVKITSGGNVNATSSGISSGTASASFSGGVLIVNSNTNVPANIQCGSVLIGDTTVSPNFVTVAAPLGLASSYSLALPSALPGSTSLLSLDSSGNIASYTSVSSGITGSAIAAGTITATNMAANSIATASIQDGAVTPAKLSSTIRASSTYSTTSTSSTSPVSVSGGSVTITGSGLRPILVCLRPANGGVSTGFTVVHANAIGQGFIRIDISPGDYVFPYSNVVQGGLASQLSSTWPALITFTIPPTAGSVTAALFIYGAAAAGTSTVTLTGGVFEIMELS